MSHSELADERDADRPLVGDAAGPASAVAERAAGAAAIPLDVAARLERRRLAPAIALVGPDGAGKSTTSAALAAAWPGDAAQIYMGMGRGLSSPHRGDPWHVPGVSAVVGIGLHWRRWLTGRRYRAQGHLVVFDRYTEDAWLPPERAGFPVRLGRRLRAIASCPAPDLLVVLDVPGAVMFERKGELDARSLEDERRRYRSLGTRRGAVVVDGTRPTADVVEAILAALWDELRSGT